MQEFEPRPQTSITTSPNTQEPMEISQETTRPIQELQTPRVETVLENEDATMVPATPPTLQ